MTSTQRSHVHVHVHVCVGLVFCFKSIVSSKAKPEGMLIRAKGRKDTDKLGTGAKGSSLSQAGPPCRRGLEDDSGTGGTDRRYNAG